MKFLRKLSAVLATILAFLASASALDREAFTFTRYDLTVRLEPEQHRLGVRGRITLRNDSTEPQHIAALQISSTLNWRSIRAVTQAASKSGEESNPSIPLQFVTQPFASDIDHTSDLSEAIVTLPREVAPRESVTLEIGYEGVVLLDATRLIRIGTPTAVARHNDWDQIGTSFTAIRGIGYVAWYPVAMEAQSLADGDAMFVALGKWKARHAESTMDIFFDVIANQLEKEPLVVCSGNNVPTVTKGGSDEIHGSLCTFESLNTVPSFAFADYEAEEHPSFRLYHSHGQTTIDFVSAGDEALDLVRNWFGTPKEKIAAVELVDAGDAPFEAGRLLFVSFAHTDAQTARMLMVHQLTRASFSSPHPWIDEGAGYFAQALAREKQNGREAALDYMERHRAAVLQVEKAATPSGGEPLVSATHEVFYRSKAALVWWMLRDMVGDATLKKAIRAYDAGADHDPAYFQHVLEERSKRDLTWFFRDWVYSDVGLPDFKADSANARQGTGANFVTAVTIENVGVAGAEVPVTIRTNNGDFTQRLEVRSKSKAVIRIATPAGPVEVVVNDGSVPESDMSNNRLQIAKDEALK